MKRIKPADECRVIPCREKGTVNMGPHYDGKEYLVCENCKKNVEKLLEGW
jgi:hypothetical protein